MLHVLVGAAVGGVVAVGSTYVFFSLTGQRISARALISAAAAGVVGGALASATLGVGGAAAAGTVRSVVAPVVGGTGGGAAYRVTHNALSGRELTEGAPEAAATGALSGAIGYGVSSAAGPALETAIRPLASGVSKAIQPVGGALGGRAIEGVGNGMREGLRTTGQAYASGAAIGATRKAVENVGEERPLTTGLAEASVEGGQLGVLRAGVGGVAGSVLPQPGGAAPSASRQGTASSASGGGAPAAPTSAAEVGVTVPPPQGAGMVGVLRGLKE